jgi:hypothetical protein
MTRGAWPWFAVLAVIVLAVCLTFARVASPSPYAYDESDYMYAGTQGFQANYFDRDAMSFAQFVRKGLDLARHKDQRTSFSQFVRDSGDISFYRHYHGPLYAYWISLWQSLGVQSEAGFRATGLILHGAGAIAIFWLFIWVFPELPIAAAFTAALVFAMNRTALVTATTITQHVAFEFVSILSLFVAGQFLRTNDRRWWHGAVALLACAFAAVEISIVLIAAVLLSICLLNWRSVGSLVMKGLLTFTAVLLVLWPMGVLTLNALKGYLYLAYMSLNRKTFSPIGPVELWGFRLTTYPLEFVIPLLVLIAILLSYRRMSALPAALPMALYSFAFLGVTIFVTLPYTHYNGSLMASIAVLTGVVFGEIWKNVKTRVRWGSLALLAASLLALDLTLYQEMAPGRDRVWPVQDLIAFLKVPAATQQSSSSLYVPFDFVPPLHFYRPDLHPVGYSTDWRPQQLADASLNTRPSRVICTPQICRAVQAVLPPSAIADRASVTQMETVGEPLEVLTIRPRTETEERPAPNN